MPERSFSTCGRLRDILLDHLRQIDAHFWPGADGLTINAVLAGYPGAAAAGRVPGLAELMRSYPELTTELQAIFSRPDDEAPGPAGWSPGAPPGAAYTCRLD